MTKVLTNSYTIITEK
jgi:hypothetical protein